MGRRADKLKKEPTPKASDKEEETTIGARDAWCPKSDPTPAQQQLGRREPARRTRRARIDLATLESQEPRPTSCAIAATISTKTRLPAAMLARRPAKPGGQSHDGNSRNDRACALTGVCGLVATTSAQHAEGRQFDPGQVQSPAPQSLPPTTREASGGASSPVPKRRERCRLLGPFASRDDALAFRGRVNTSRSKMNE
jgi:hypothetical protein